MTRPHRVAAIAIFFVSVLVRGSPQIEETVEVDETVQTNDDWDYRGTEPCPSDSSIVGYASLANLQSDLTRHSSLLGSSNLVVEEEEDNQGEQKEPSPVFVYTLCPSIFDMTGNEEPLFIPPELLHFHPTIQCADDSHASTSTEVGTTCIIQGGKRQIMIGDASTSWNYSSNTDTTPSTSGTFKDASIVLDSLTNGMDEMSSTNPTAGTTMNTPGSFDSLVRSIHFRGLTFVDSEEVSVAILMFPSRTDASLYSTTRTTNGLSDPEQQHLPVEATFSDCHWRANKGQAAILLAPVQLFGTPGDDDVEMIDQDDDVDDDLVWNKEDDNFDDDDDDKVVLEERASEAGGLRKRRHMAAMNSARSTPAGPLFRCIDCTFQDGGEFVSSTEPNRFGLIDSFLPEARIILSSSQISNISAASFLINVVHGASLHMQNVHIRDSKASVALIQAKYQSLLHARELILERNAAEVTILVDQDSQAVVTNCQFQQDNADGIPISMMVLSSSQLSIQESCLPISPSTSIQSTSETTPSIVVDDSSWVDFDEKTVRTSDDSSSSSTNSSTPSLLTTSLKYNVEPISFSCQGSVWLLDGPGDCLDQGGCTGRCQSIPIVAQCRLGDGNIEWSHVLQSSSTGVTMSSTIMMMMAIGTLALLLI